MSMRFQAGLGRVVQDSSVYRKDTKMYETTLGKVIKVNHSSGTLDVVLTDGTVIVEDPHTKTGGVVMTQNSSGYDANTGAYWGTIRPIAVGTWVLIGFLDALKSNPILLATLPNSSHNLYTELTLVENKAGWNRGEALKTLEVYPDMSYRKVDGEGNREMTFANKSFFKTLSKNYDPDNIVTDNHLGYDFADLSETDSEGNVLETKFDECKEPTKMLFVHRTDFDDLNTTWTKFYLGMDGLFRLTRDNNDNTLSFMEFAKDGTYKLKRILNSSYDEEEATQYSQFVISKEGEIVLQRVEDEKSTAIGVGQDNVAFIETADGSYIRLGENIELEAQGELVSETLQKFIRNYHIVVSETEPDLPEQMLVWIDVKNEGAPTPVLSVDQFDSAMERVNAMLEELQNKTGADSEFVTDANVGNIVNNILTQSTYTTINDVQNIINNTGSDVEEFTIEDITSFWNDAKS